MARHSARQTSIDRAAPYLALVELYRTWGYTKEAIAVGELGAKRLSATESTTADVLYSLAAAHHARKSYARAVSALTLAYKINPRHHAALLYRGQAYLRLGKRIEARRDVEAFLAATESNRPIDFVRAQAMQVLRDVGAVR
jgi:tetratricopeptide (TPR) repeat protein